MPFKFTKDYTTTLVVREELYITVEEWQGNGMLVETRSI